MLRDTASSTHLAQAPPREVFASIAAALDARVVGQQTLTQRLLIALLCDGHVLVEGVPGLAKTTAVKTLAELLEADFHRIQFTPDLLPADLTGTEVFRAETGNFEFRPGPIFRSLVLADEINRAPAKVQSALLEAMEERQVSVGRASFALPELFMVMATQNPIEQDGTYPLPEAQLDRFLIHVQVEYPAPEAEHAILQLARDEALHSASGGAPGPRIPVKAIASSRSSSSSSYWRPAIRAPTTRASTRWCGSAQARARPSGSTALRARTPGSPGAATSRPKTFMRLRRTCCAIAWC
jgi:MoxR-like ATPase